MRFVNRFRTPALCLSLAFVGGAVSVQVKICSVVHVCVSVLSAAEGEMVTGDFCSGAVVWALAGPPPNSAPRTAPPPAPISAPLPGPMPP